MNASVLIKLIEDYCKENNLNIANTYDKLAELYQDKEYGINPNIEKDIYCQNNGLEYIGMPEYLEKVNTIDRYVMILNKMIRGEYDE